MTTYHSHEVNLSKGQRNKSGITIRLNKSDLAGNDSLMLTKRQINQLNKAKKSGVGSDSKISQTQIRKFIGGNAPRIGTSGGGAPRMRLFPSIGVSVPRSRSRRSTPNPPTKTKKRWKNHE